MFAQLARAHAAPSPQQQEAPDQQSTREDFEPAVVEYNGNRFEPQCTEQWDPEAISIALDIGEDVDFRGLRQGNRVWHIKNGNFYPVKLPDHARLSGVFTVLVKQKVVMNSSAPPAPAAEASNPEVLEARLSKPDDCVALKIKSRDVTITRSQLFRHFSLPQVDRMRDSYLGSVRLELVKAVISTLITPTTEAAKRLGVHQQRQPGIAVESFLHCIKICFPGLADVRLPSNSKKNPNALRQQGGRLSSHEDCGFVSREIFGKAVSQVYSVGSSKARSNKQSPAIVKRKSTLLIPEGEVCDDYANKHNINLHSDKRIFAYHGLRLLDPCDEKGIIISNIKASMLAWWMIEDEDTSKLLASLKECRDKNMVYVESCTATLAKKSENLKRALKKYNATIACNKKRRMSAFINGSSQAPLCDITNRHEQSSAASQDEEQSAASQDEEQSIEQEPEESDDDDNPFDDNPFSPLRQNSNPFFSPLRQNSPAPASRASASPSVLGEEAAGLHDDGHGSTEELSDGVGDGTKVVCAAGMRNDVDLDAADATGGSMD